VRDDTACTVASLCTKYASARFKPVAVLEKNLQKPPKSQKMPYDIWVHAFLLEVSKLKRAFTLIELLVVIAIIAILAAILFPVFAQAKTAAKKTAYISNIKQSGTGVQIYLSDSDDVFPLAMGVRPENGTWGIGVAHPVPADALDPTSANGVPWASAGRQNMANTMWANSCQPYIKNYQMLANPNAPQTAIGGDVFTNHGKSAFSGIQYNGLLHSLSSSSVVGVSVVPAFWNVQNYNLQGRNFSSPALDCGSLGGVPDPCQFNPSGNPSAHVGPNGTPDSFYVLDFTTPVWLYGQKMVVGRCDTSTKTVPVGTVIAPGVAAFPSLAGGPWAQVTATGAPGGYYPCDSTFASQAGADYVCYFRPDRSQ
jgi:prepilin-type N-terminal cleavage/methylation domain-containing protein